MVLPGTIPRPRFAWAPPFKRGQAAAPLVEPCSAGPIPRPARRRPGPFEKGLRRSRWGLICRHYFDLKSEVEDGTSRDNPPPSLRSATPFAKGGKRLRRLWGPASQGSSPVPPAGGLAPLKRGSAKRWGLICWHYFCLKAQIKAAFLRQSPAFASFSPFFAKGGKRLRRLGALLCRANPSSRSQAAWPL